MKTIIDAVNEFQGVWPKSIPTLNADYPSYNLRSRKQFIAFATGARITKEQFNAIVSEMSEGFEEYKREYEDMSMTANAFDRSGNGYRIGHYYSMRVDGGVWAGATLAKIEHDDTRQFVDTDGDRWDDVSIITAPLGTITPAPVELNEGQIYMFDMGVTTSEIIGRYYVAVTGEKMFDLVGNNRFVKISDCTNIIPLVPEVT